MRKTLRGRLEAIESRLPPPNAPSCIRRDWLALASDEQAFWRELCAGRWPRFLALLDQVGRMTSTPLGGEKLPGQAIVRALPSVMVYLNREEVLDRAEPGSGQGTIWPDPDTQPFLCLILYLMLEAAKGHDVRRILREWAEPKPEPAPPEPSEPGEQAAPPEPVSKPAPLPAETTRSDQAPQPAPPKETVAPQPAQPEPTKKPAKQKTPPTRDDLRTRVEALAERRGWPMIQLPNLSRWGQGEDTWLRNLRSVSYGELEIVLKCLNETPQGRIWWGQS